MGQIRGNNIVVTVTPDHKDWNYKVGEKAQFVVNVLRSGTLIDNAVVDYEAGPEMYPDVSKKNVTLKDGTMKWTGTMKTPGFYRLKVTAHVGGKSYVGMCTAGFSPEQLQPATKCPADFDAFWEKVLNEARKNALDPHLTLLPDRCTETVNVYEVSFVNDRPLGRIYGILCRPVKPGKYPALLRVPGAGSRPYGGDVWTASQGAIVLEIGIHGIPVTMEQKVYDNLNHGAFEGYWETNLDQPDKNYYKRVVAGAVRAVDYIASLPEWNGKDIGVTGASQGGFLSLAVAALDKRITFMVAVHDAMCDYEIALQQRACGWPHYFYQQKNPDMRKVEGARYYDGINFARRVACPSFFTFGYNDEVVPPSSSWSVYNVVKAPKTISLYQMTGHYWYQEQWDEWENWLLQQMGIKN
jgi:cephalosporin-C deacetylase-like acetyl esterase